MTRYPIFSSDVLAKIESAKGIWLDIGCGANKTKGAVGMDRRDVDGVDIVHDLEVLPWPVPDAVCYRILASHIFEHIDPGKMLDVIEECWRIMKPGGQLLIAMPYPGSPRYWQDPTHRHAWNETTPHYFCPAPGNGLYEVYRPSPWALELNEYHSVGDINIIMAKQVLYGSNGNA